MELLGIIIAVWTIVFWVKNQGKEEEKQSCADNIKQTLQEYCDCGKRISNRYDAQQVIWDILKETHAKLKKEVVVALFLNNDNKVVGAHWNIGDSVSVECPTNVITAHALQRKASKVLLGHNHPIGSASPSDNDVAHCAGLYLSLRAENISLMDDLVFCHGSLKSIMHTHRFKQMLRAY